MIETCPEGIIMYNTKLLDYDHLTESQEGGRLSSIIKELKQGLIWDRIAREADIAPMKRLRDIHEQGFLNDLHRRAYSGLEKLDEHTPLIKEAFEIARFGAGGVLDAVDLIMAEEVKTAFCITAMPGHHAGISSQSFGSLINPMAAGAHYLTKKYGMHRIVILDLDAEHGIGTQQIFYSRKNVMTISLHEYPGVTGTGHYEELGGKGAQGFNINIPFASGYGDREYRVCIKEFVEKILAQYQPEFIILGFGTNVLMDDLASRLRVSEKGLVSIVQQVKEMANRFCKGKIISVLEGGTPGNLMSKASMQHATLLLNNFVMPVDRVSKDELISYADWYSYAKLLKRQFKKFWKL